MSKNTELWGITVVMMTFFVLGGLVIGRGVYDSGEELDLLRNYVCEQKQLNNFVVLEFDKIVDGVVFCKFKNSFDTYNGVKIDLKTKDGGG